MIPDQQQSTLAVSLADSLAAYLLRNRTDKHGKPLIDHSRRVASKVANLSVEQHVSALLHDVSEETANDPVPITPAWIAALFGYSIANLVDILTPRPNRTYEQYIEVVALYPRARAIKLADLEDNLDPTRGPIEPSLRERYERARQLLIDRENEEKAFVGVATGAQKQ